MDDNFILKVRKLNITRQIYIETSINRIKNNKNIFLNTFF